MVYFVKVGSVKDIGKDKFRRYCFGLNFASNSQKKGLKWLFLIRGESLLRSFNSIILFLPPNKICPLKLKVWILLVK